MRTGYVTVDGVRLHYREWGDRVAPDLLLVHGWATGSVVWIEVAEALSDSFHVVTPDNRGNGESDAPECGYELTRLRRRRHGHNTGARAATASLRR